jgi:hypothetical protein
MFSVNERCNSASTHERYIMGQSTQQFWRKKKKDATVSTFVLLAVGGNTTCFDHFLGHLQAYKNTDTGS